MAFTLSYCSFKSSFDFFSGVFQTSTQYACIVKFIYILGIKSFDMTKDILLNLEKDFFAFLVIWSNRNILLFVCIRESKGR